MYPYERSLVGKMENRPFVLLGVNSDRDRGDLKKAMAKEKITWRSFWNGGQLGPISQRWGVHAWPTMFVIDHEGVLRAKYIGSPGEKVLDEKLEALVKAAEKSKKAS